MSTVDSVQFDMTKAELQIAAKIARRAVKLSKAHGGDYEQQDAVMDLDACHSNGCPLKLEALLEADDFNFAHDVFGIRRHLDRSTGELGGCFLPRFAV